MKRQRALSALFLLASLAASGQTQVGHNGIVELKAGENPPGTLVAAINTAGRNATIVLPATYSEMVNAQIAINNPNVHLRCERGAVLTQKFNGDLIRVTADNFEISSCRLDTNGVATGWSAVHVIAANHCKIRDNEFSDPRAPQFDTQIGVRIEGTTSATANYCEVSGNTFKMPWIGVSLAKNANFNDVHDNWFLDGGEAFDFNGAGVDSTYDTFHNNMVIGGFGASFLESVTGATVTDNKFVRADGAHHTIYVHLAQFPNSTRSTISNNDFYGSGETAVSAIWIYDNTTKLFVANNTIRNYGGDGILVGTSAGPVQDIDFIGNVISANGMSAASKKGFCGINLAQTHGHAVNRINFLNNRIGEGASDAASGQSSAICSGNPQSGERSIAPTNVSSMGNIFGGGLDFPAGCTGCNISETKGK